MRRAALLVLALGGCEQNLLKDLPDATTPDAAIDAAATMNVDVVAHDVWLTDTGSIEMMRDLSTYQLASPSGVGTAGADGSIVVHVPAGATSWDLGYTAGPRWHLEGNATTVDLGVHQIGRPNAAKPNLATPFHLELTDLAPWGGATDHLEIMSSNAGVFFEWIPEILVVGDTSLSSKTVDWLSLNLPLVDAAQGDTTILTQLSTRMAGTELYAGLAKAGPATGFTQVDGTASTLSVALADVPQKTIAVQWQRDPFEKLRGQAGPSAADGTQHFGIDALPALDAQPYGWSPDLLLYQPATGSTELDLTFAYGNPFATAGQPWAEFAFVSYPFTVPVAAGSATPYDLAVGYIANGPLEILAPGGVIAPQVSGVRELMIAGHDALVPQSGTGTTPTITWDVPELGAVDDYQLAIFSVETNGATTNARLIGMIDTKQTSVVMPADLLAAGSTYVLTVAAVIQPGIDLTAIPLSYKDRVAVFRVATAQFSP